MTEQLRWPRWARGLSPATLTQYVHTGAIARLLATPLPSGEPARAPGQPALPGPGSGAALHRLRAIYDAMLWAEITYANEPPGGEPGRQLIRPPDEVLVAPRQGTCLDLAVTYAGACLDAGLHPMIAVLDPPNGGPSHAIVIVWLGTGQDDDTWTEGAASDYPLRGRPAVHDAIPEPVLNDLRHAVDEPGEFVAIDVTLAAHGRLPFEQALSAGAATLSERMRWSVGVDIATGFRNVDSLPFDYSADANPVVPAYEASPSGALGPLGQLRARTGRARFRDRDELELLLEWCQQSREIGPGGHTTRVAIITGSGGSGKTHLAAELCTRMHEAGWYTGFLARKRASDDTRALRERGLRWLAGTASPLLVVMDYAESATNGLEALLCALDGRRHAPTFVVLTARSQVESHDAGWWADLVADLTDHGVALPQPTLIELPDLHPHPGGVFRRALEVFAAPATPPQQAWRDLPRHRWTTLDFVLLAWLAVNESGSPAPVTRTDLYEQILSRELRYWRRTIEERHSSAALPSSRTLRQAAACISLLTPTVNRLHDTLTAVTALSTDRRDQVAAVCADVLPSDADDMLAVRPDPIADYLLLVTFNNDHELLRRCVQAANEVELANLCATLTRAADTGLGGDADVIAAIAVDSAPEALWRPALALGAAIGGPLINALEQIARRPDSGLPLADILAGFPRSNFRLAKLALIAIAQGEPATDSGIEVRAYWLTALSTRQSDNGDRVSALASITEAVEHFRRLVEADPNTYLPDLATSLNNLCVQQGDNGDRTGALMSITEAVTIRRRLAEADPAAFLPDLATSLNNLSIQQSENGDRTHALASITEAIGHYRQLAGQNPTAYLPELAAMLNNMSVLQSGNGDRTGAMDSITEAIAIRRRLAEANPAAFLPDLATSLNNLSVRQSENGDLTSALASITEATDHYRHLAEANPAAFLPFLATAMINLSNRTAEHGDRVGALQSITEAVAIRRRLAEANPAAFLPDLAMSLNNLSIRQSENGDLTSALASITEATDHYRRLAEANPAAFLPFLATAMVNLSNRTGEHGDRVGALQSITEAVAIRRRLAEANPGAFLPDLAMSLNNLSGRQANNGDRVGALESITEAVAIRRRLVEANPAAFLPDLATSLNNLAIRQTQNGDRVSALESITEAVTHLRRLVEVHPTAFVPDLATSLSNLAGRQSDNGDRAGALQSITEAVAIRRRLVEANPAAFLPDLAMSLNNLSIQQSDNGDHRGALQSITESVTHLRRLVEANPTAFLPDLATSLSNLSGRQHDLGDHAAALVSVTEAVGHYRHLTETHPAAFLPDLAMSLNNLSIQQSDNGDHGGALQSITESVAIRRRLVEANPAAFLPDLAISLNNLSGRQRDAADHAGALRSATEAVGHYRRLTETHPAAFLPDLAMSLNNLSIQQSDNGDHGGALQSITEAAAHLRHLTAANPAAFLPHLATALRELADQLREGHGELQAATAFTTDLEALRPGAVALLLVHRARWLLSHGLRDHAISDLSDASQIVDDDPAWLGRSRRAVHAIAGDLGSENNGSLPAWAVTALPPGILAVFDDWLTTSTWSEREAWVRQYLAGPFSASGKAALQQALVLLPEVNGLTQLETLLSTIDSAGLNPTLDMLRSQAEHQTQFEAWLATRTWAESYEFAQRHPALLRDARTSAALDRLDPADAVVVQHRAILALTADGTPLAEVYDLLTDRNSAAEAALRAVDANKLDLGWTLYRLCPQLLAVPFTGHYVLAILAAAADDAEDHDHAVARSAMAKASQEATDTQRRAGSSRLRRLCQHRPQDAARLSELVELLSGRTAPLDNS